MKSAAEKGQVMIAYPLPHEPTKNTGIDLGIGLPPVLEALGPTSAANNSSLPISSVQSGPNMFYVFLVGSGEVIDRTL